MTCKTCSDRPGTRTVRANRWVALSAFAAFLGSAFWLTGSIVHDLVEGLQRSKLSLWKLGVTAGALIASVILARGRWSRPLCESCGRGSLRGFLVPVRSTKPEPNRGRRAALRALGTGGLTVVGAAAGIAAAVGRNRGWVAVARDFFFVPVETAAPAPRPEWGRSAVKNYRRLGRTNALVSDISFGSSRIQDVEVARQALERGVTYFDTAPDYAETGSEQVLGKAIAGRRDKVFVATKFCVADGHLPNDTPVPKIIEAVHGSLRRLQTDYVDLIHIHSCDRLDRLMAPNIHEAFDRLKEQGKARFLGVSTHSPNLEQVANAAIDSGRFDVMMLAYHFAMWSSFERILERAKQHDVGVVAMKTLKGAKHVNLADFREEAGSYSQAAFRWVLSNPNVSCLVVSFSKPQHVDEYLYASGQLPQPSDVALLRSYDRLTAGDYCQPHCGRCLSSCPESLPINDILRYRMYFRDYGWEKEGMRLYARVERAASTCLTCPAPCSGTCPIGVPIRQKMLDAHALLTLV